MAFNFRLRCNTQADDIRNEPSTLTYTASIPDESRRMLRNVGSCIVLAQVFGSASTPHFSKQKASNNAAAALVTLVPISGPKGRNLPSLQQAKHVRPRPVRCALLCPPHSLISPGTPPSLLPLSTLLSLPASDAAVAASNWPSSAARRCTFSVLFFCEAPPQRGGQGEERGMKS